MQVKFIHQNKVETNLTSHKKPLDSVRMANGTGHLYVKPRYAKDHWVCVGEFVDGIGIRTNTSNQPPHCGWEEWLKYLYNEGHKSL